MIIGSFSPSFLDPKNLTTGITGWQEEFGLNFIKYMAKSRRSIDGAYYDSLYSLQKESLSFLHPFMSSTI